MSEQVMNESTDFARRDFKLFVEGVFVPFMKKYQLSQGTISNGFGARAVVRRDKHGFYSVTITETQSNV